MKRKKIVIDATPLLYTQQGIGRATRMLIEGLLHAECDYDVTLYGRRLQGERLKNIVNGYRSVHLRLPRASEKFLLSTRLIETLCCGNLYHATDFYMPLRQPYRAVATIHDMIFLKDIENVIDHKRLLKWVPAFARQCRKIITVSNSVKESIIETLQLDPSKINVIHWGVDEKLFRPEDDTEALQRRVRSILGFNRPYFLAVSCYTERKNTHRLLEAYAVIAKNFPTHDLVLLWNAPEQIREKYNTSHLTKRIHYLDRQTDESLRDLYCGASALVFPSLDEGFGLPILEAMSCGTPVVTSNISAMPEVGGDAAIYIDPNDTWSLGHVLENFENNSYNKELLRQQSLLQASKFTWTNCVQKTLEVYAQCLED